jgi:cytochrome o ubiquinol oxidase operon protein cyoD
MNTNSTQKRLSAYVLGFVLSLALTACAFALVVMHLLEPDYLVAAILGLALLQIFVQINFFFHFGEGRDGKERLVVLCFAGLIVVIIAGGSLWIMRNLNERMMPDATGMSQYMVEQEGI